MVGVGLDGVWHDALQRIIYNVAVKLQLVRSSNETFRIGRTFRILYSSMASQFLYVYICI
jgi:hypothetical protein